MILEKLFRKKNPDEIHQEDATTLVKSLTFIDLTSMGIAAVIGAGIFGTIGKASFDGGPAVSLLFLFTAVACLCSALCYAHFASSVRGSGSAYTYAYITFGEIIAWIIGWDLLMEYAIGNIAVAISWSDYFTSLLRNLHVPLPEYLSVDYLSAQKFYHEYSTIGKNASYVIKEGYAAWLNAPQIAGLPDHRRRSCPAHQYTDHLAGLYRYQRIQKNRQCAGVYKTAGRLAGHQRRSFLYQSRTLASICTERYFRNFQRYSRCLLRIHWI